MSGVFAGIYALAGAYIAYIMLGEFAASFRDDVSRDAGMSVKERLFGLYVDYVLLAAAILVASIVTAYVFSNRKAKREGQNLFDHTAIRVLINLCIPLVAGGLFCLALLYHGAIVFIAPCMLLFYGMALINASKYTYDDIRYFGICEIILGLINAFNLGNGLLYWSLGFGVLHIVYGAVMWFKYEKKS
ncbi:MAG: hypothetical protein IPH32_08865 [Bacteroidetes bacterium]|nr:hypothetical protein [Bacteroidota bacterium]